MNINRKISKYNFNKGSVSRIKYIVIHYVGALGGAEDNCRYYGGGNRNASAHYFVGFNGEVWQCVEDANIAWHCGASSYKHAECRNANSIGIEMCVRKKNTKSMGAIFRQRVLKMSIDELDEFTRRQCLPLFGAALSDKAADIRNAELHRSAVAIGSEGRGLSRELLDICGGELIIPMNPHSESLNAAIAASVIMWEMSR